MCSAIFGCTSAQSMENAPPPAIKMTLGDPFPVQYRCNLRPPPSVIWPGDGYDRDCAVACKLTAAIRAPARNGGEMGSHTRCPPLTHSTGVHARKLRLLSHESDYCFAQVKVPIQLGSQVLPPSVEKACSVRNELDVTSEKTKRTKIDLSLKSSWSKNSPRELSN